MSAYIKGYMSKEASTRDDEPYQDPGVLGAMWEGVRTSPYSLLNTRTGYLRRATPLSLFDPGSDQFIPNRVWKAADDYVAKPLQEMSSRRANAFISDVSESAGENLSSLNEPVRALAHQAGQGAAEGVEKGVTNAVDRVTGGLGDALKPFLSFFSDGQGNINWQNLAWLLPALGLGSYGLLGQGGGLGRAIGGTALGLGAGLGGRHLWGQHGGDWMDYFNQGREQATTPQEETQ